MISAQFIMTPERRAAFQPGRSLWSGPNGLLGQFFIVRLAGKFFLNMGGGKLAPEGSTLAWVGRRVKVVG